MKGPVIDSELHWGLLGCTHPNSQLPEAEIIQPVSPKLSNLA